MKISKKLDHLGERLAAARQELQVALEQLSFQNEVTDEAETRMVVSQTPLADREFKETQQDLERHKRFVATLQTEIDELLQQRDKLLEEMLG